MSIHRVLPTAVVVLILVAAPLHAHHGWGWTSDEVKEISGVITESRLGNPHGELTLDVDGESWKVEVGQPWRNDEAGLTEDNLAVDREITVLGNPDADGDTLMKAIRVTIDGTHHDLYADRVPEDHDD